MNSKPNNTTKAARPLKARPEEEDFEHKYTEEGSGKVGGMLIDNYFKNVAALVGSSGVADVKNARAIEIGCGAGYSTQRLGKLLPKNVTLEASEYVAHMIPTAKKLNPSIKITEENTYELRRKDGEFDLVFLLEVLEHLDFPETGLAELKRITKPGGHLVLGVPREPLWCALNLARGKYIRSFGNTPGHLNHWSARGIKNLVRQHFGPVIEVKTPLPWTILLAKKP